MTASITPINFDAFASTALHPKVYRQLVMDLQDPILSVNPSSQHAFGQKAHEIYESQTLAIQKSLNLYPGKWIWTSSSTESIHLAILGAIEAYPRHEYHLLTWDHEHSATLGALKRARKLFGAKAHILPGPHIDWNLLEETLRQFPVFLISLSWVQHELGTEQDWKKACQLARRYGCLLHLDASQAVGKCPIAIEQHDLPDLITFSSHKCFGPKNIAGLYLSSLHHRRVSALWLGGGQQHGQRAGTFSLPLLKAMTLAYQIAHQELETWMSLHQQYSSLITSACQKAGWIDHGIQLKRVPQTAYLCVPSSHKNVWEKTILSSQGSACGHAQGLLSPTLQGLGVPNEMIAQSYRVSWSHQNSMHDIEKLIELLLSSH